MRIVDTLTGILEAMRQDASSPLKSWQYNSPSRANVEHDYSRTPCAVMYCITDWSVNLNIARETAQVAVGFLTENPRLDYNGLDADGIIDGMKAVALDFLARMADGGAVEVTGDSVRIRSAYADDDRNLAGVFLEMEVRELQGECLQNYITL